MGGNGSTARKVSFGLDEDEKVTVIEGVKVIVIDLKRSQLKIYNVKTHTYEMWIILLALTVSKWAVWWCPKTDRSHVLK